MLDRGRWIDGRYGYVDILTGRLYELREDAGPTAPRQLARLDVPLGELGLLDEPDGTTVR